MQRDGPGLLLRDILRGDAADVAAVRALIDRADADILVISGFDYDQGLVALSTFRDGLGPGYPHVAATRPNAGLATDADLDGDGYMRGAGDAQGFGAFAGQGGIAVLSRFPVRDIRDYNAVLWRDLPGTLLVESDPGGGDQRLASVGHVSVVLEAPGGDLTLLAFHATPPVFDGPEDRNGRRNHDETAFWLHYLDGAFGPAPETAFVLAGDANLDPVDGDGRPDAITALLADPRLQDPRPSSDTGRALAIKDGGANAGQGGDPRLDTANWNDGRGDPGNLRVDYVLPSRDLTVHEAGILWGDGAEAPRHGLVWVEFSR